MSKKLIVSKRLVHSKAALIGMTLTDVCREAGLGGMYLSRIWEKDTVKLNTLNRVARVLNCSAKDLIEEIDEKVEEE